MDCEVYRAIKARRPITSRTAGPTAGPTAGSTTGSTVGPTVGPTENPFEKDIEIEAGPPGPKKLRPDGSPW